MGARRNSISIVIPVVNEEAIINQAVDHIFTLDRDGEIEVIVVDGSPDATTVNAIRRRDVVRVVGDKGRARQMNAGAARAEGEVLLFLHADTRLPDSALRRISAVMERGVYAAGAFDLGIESPDPAFRIIEKAASLRSRITRIPYGDQAIFIRRDCFERLGGFADIPLMEDVDLMRRIKKNGGAIHIIPEKVKTSPRRWEKEGILSCTVRNWTLITLYLLGMSPGRLARFYR